MLPPKNPSDQADPVYSPRRRAILEGLRFLGPGPAEFYLDALRILAAPPRFSTASHLVAHCLREVESALRQAFLPAGYDRGSDGQENVRQIRAALSALDVPEEGSVGQLWLSVANRHDLPSRAHRRNLLPPRAIETDTLDFVERLEVLFEGVLSASETHYIPLLQRLEGLAAEKQPSKADLEFVERRMPRNPVTLGHFFGALDSAGWLRPLMARGMFEWLPGVVALEDGKVSIPQWVESRYLAKVASSEPDLVVQVVRELPPSDNPHVYEGIADIAMALPSDAASELVPPLISGLELPFVLMLPHKVEEVVEKLARSGNVDQALTLAATLLRILPPNESPSPPGLYGARSVMNEWDYGQALVKLRPALLKAAPHALLRLLCNLLDSAVRQSRPSSSHPDRDYSDMWREEISSEEDEHMDIANCLVSAVSLTAQEIVAVAPERIDDVTDALHAGHFPVFRRILLEMARHAGHVPLTSQLLTQEDLVEAWSPEYQKLLRQEFGRVSAETQDKILERIAAGPSLDKVRRWLDGTDGGRPSDLEVANAADDWRRDQLEVMGEALPQRWTERLGHIKVDSPPRDLAFGPRRLMRTGQLLGPVQVDVAKMDRSALLKYLLGIGEADPWSGRGLHDVPGAIRQYVGSNPSWPGELDDDFRAISLVMIQAIVDGYGQGFDKGESLPWAQVLRSCQWVIRKVGRNEDGTEQVSRADAAHAQKMVLWLLERGMKKSERSILIAERGLVWSIITAVAERQTDAEDERESTDAGLPGAASANSVPGSVLSVAIEYGQWIDENTDQKASMKSLPELAILLERQFDPAMQRDPIVGEVFGRYFPTLRFFDKEWTIAHVDDMFSRSPAGITAWRTFLIFWGAYTDAFQEIRPFYVESLREFPRSEVPEAKVGDWGRDLGEHLIVYRAWAGIEEADEDLLDEFFSVAPVDLRRHALEYPGFVLSRTDADPPAPQILDRLMRVWESRERHYAEHSSVDATEELRSFGYWFTSAAFPVDWSVEHLVRALELGGKIDSEHQVVARLAALDDAHLGAAVRALTIMSADDDDPWRILSWGSDGHSILDRGRRSGDAGVGANAADLISRLLRRGYDNFKDLVALPGPT